MIGVPPAAILHAVLVIEVVNHFVKKGSYHAFNRSGQRACADVDFTHSCFAVNAPSIKQGVMAVSLGRALNGDDRP